MKLINTWKMKDWRIFSEWHIYVGSVELLNSSKSCAKHFKQREHSEYCGNFVWDSSSNGKCKLWLYAEWSTQQCHIVIGSSILYSESIGDNVQWVSEGRRVLRLSSKQTHARPSQAHQPSCQPAWVGETDTDLVRFINPHSSENGLVKQT